MASQADADHKLIESITYMASLASQPQAIDNILDKLRLITSTVQPGQALSADNRATLLAAREDIAQYLTSREALRTFTRESLAQKLNLHNRPEQEVDTAVRLKDARRKVWLTSAGAIVLPLVVLWQTPLATRIQLAIPLFLLTLHLGIIWFYLSALRTFTPALRRVYAFICGGIFIIGLGAAQFPLISAFSLESLPIMRYGGIQTIFAVACVPIYVGVRLFAKVVGVKSAAASPWVAGLGCVGVIAASVVVPHAAYVPQEVIYDTMIASLMVCAVLLLLSARLIFLIRRSVTTKYATALGWFMAALIGLGIGSIEYSTVTYFAGETYGLVANLAFLPFMIAELLLLQSGYTFKKASHD